MLKTKLKRYFISGIFIVVPVIITFWVLKALFIFFDELIKPYLEPQIGFWVSGLGIIITVVLVLLVGIAARNIVFRNTLMIGEKILYKLPIVKVVYSSVKQIMQTFSGGDHPFQRVVLLEYPKEGVWSVGFVNGETNIPGDAVKKLNILVLAAINPTSGFFVMVEEDKTVPLDIKVEEAIKWVVSGGLVTPQNIEDLK
jgi:uncharacterized membrane protein